MMNWQELLKQGKAFLESEKIADAEFDALQLILTFFGGSHTEYTLHLSDKINESDRDKYFELIQRRVSGEPLQYIIGKWDFYKSSFFVGRGVLIPRPETEELVESCVSIVKKNGYKVVYDLCTGSGCIGLSMAKECPDVTFYLFEYYDDALAYAKKNLFELGLSNVNIYKHDILTAYPDLIPSADIIVSNPPYISSVEMASLQYEVLQEPATALDGGEDGLMFYRAIFDKWNDKLSIGGYFAFECGEEQSEAINHLAGIGFNTDIREDVYGVSRFVFCKKL